MTNSSSSIRQPANMLRAFEKIAESDWNDGIPLKELLIRVNAVAVEFLPEEAGQQSRVKRLFTERSFRHYQTIGCIDSPEKKGNRALYGFHHLVQALLVRKLLWERMSLEQIAALMAGRSTDDIKQMFLGGIEMVARVDESPGASTLSNSPTPGAVEIWKRVQVAPGVELHLRDDLPMPNPRELTKIVERLESALRRRANES